MKMITPLRPMTRAGIVVPNFTFVSDFENNFRAMDMRDWLDRYYYLSVYFIIAYLIFIFTGRKFMESRPAYHLRRPLFYWNLFLSVFSFMGALRTTNELLFVIREFGLKFSVCELPFNEHFNMMGFWSSLFVGSKCLELGDTVFIVLRKQPLIFLHYYHHITVLLYVWLFSSEMNMYFRFFMSMNYAVHSFMYFYFALKALQVKVPRFVSVLLTLGQISQMLGGLAVVSYTYMQVGKEYCHVTTRSLNYAIAMYFSYFVLFSHFFIDAYLNNTSIMNRISLKKTE